MLQAATRNDVQTVSMKNYVTDSMNYKNSRNFDYRLNEKSAKSKLMKSTKRAPFEIEENSTSSTMLFCLGSWYGIVLSSIAYWDEIRAEKTCNIGGYKVRIIGFKTGTDSTSKHIDTQIVANL